VTRPVVLALGIGVLASVAATQAQKQEFGFPHIKRLGAAIVEYRDTALHVVLSYQYSQDHHGSSWLLVDFGARSERRFVIERQHFRLVADTGEWFPVASERHFVESAPEITSLRQNAQVWRRDLTNYLGPERREPMKFFALPGEGVITTGAIVDREHNTLGELYFEAPGGGWGKGEYALLIEHPDARVKLPLTLN